MAPTAQTNRSALMDPEKRIAKILLNIGFGAGMIIPCNGQDLPGDIRSGKRLAEAWCSTCHRIDSNPGVGAPDFDAVANLPSTTPLSLKVFLRTSHELMPDLRITDAEADNLIAYILSLRKQ